MAQKLCSGASEADPDMRPEVAWPPDTTPREEASIGAYFKTSRIGTTNTLCAMPTLRRMCRHKLFKMRLPRWEGKQVGPKGNRVTLKISLPGRENLRTDRKQLNGVLKGR